MAFEFLNLVNAASGVLFIALGLFVARVPGNGAGNRGFALFAMAFGGAMILLNLSGDGTIGFAPRDAFEAVAVAGYGLLFLAAAAGIVVIARRFPASLGAPERRSVAVAASVGAIIAALWLAPYADPTLRPALATGPLELAAAVAFYGFISVLWAVLVLFALRFQRAPPEARPAALPYPLMSMALVLYPAYLAGYFQILLVVIPTTPLLYAAWMAASLAPPLLLAGLWLRAIRPGPGSGAARAMAWVCLGADVAGMAGQVIAQGDNIGFGIARTLGVLVLAYAILKHQLLGIDVKVRWTISRGTVAAVFIAVFLVVTQVAQNYLQGYGPLMGGVAAGTMLFAIQPIQRAAERVASVAVPLPGDSAAGTQAAQTARRGATHAAIYRDAARYALHDGSVSRAEHLHLAELATALRLSPEEAFHLREEAEAEVAAARRRATGEVRR